LNFDDVYKKYYIKIFSYCSAKLKDTKLAEECTQDVFLAFSRKMHKINLMTNIEAWLYKAAQYQIKTYCKKKRNEISFETLEENELTTYDSDSSDIFDNILNDDEIKTLTDFYVSGEKIDKIAENNNLSIKAAYQKIRRIKQKILKNYDKFNNFLKK